MKLLRHFVLSLLILVGIGSSNTVQADHVLGGSISWDCISSGPDAGKFRFFLTIYRNCASNQTITPFIKSETYAPLGNMSMTLLSSNDVSPTQCGVSCATAQPGDAGLIEELIYQSAPVTIDEVPPATGHVFSYYACCRGNVDNIVNPLSYLMYFRAVMYPYEGQNMNPCYDSSPRFVAPSNSLLCSGYQFRYSTAAVDPDQDSTSYDWSQTFGYDDNVNVTIPVTFQPGFSFSNPLPGPNPSTLDQSTGMISYDTDAALQGKWNMTVAAYGWRNGTLVSENTRELVLETSSCPLANQVPQTNGAANTSITVNAGDLVTFDIGATDQDQPLGFAQNITMTAIGNQFANDYTNVNGCANPPCATLTNVPPAVGSASVNTTFNWQTDCSHLPTFAEFAVTSYTYNFVFRFDDDHCPIPGISYANVSVTVLGDEVLPSPEPRCVSIIDDNNIQIEWQTITPIVPMPTSFEYVIYHSTTGLLGSWTEVGTEPNVGVGSFIHSTGMPTNPISTGPNYYQVRTRSGCPTNPVVDAALYSVSSIHLDLTNNGSTVDLNWTPVATPPLPSSNGGGTGLYQVFEENPTGSGNWSIIYIGTDLSYSFPVTVCNEPRSYRIELTDNLVCTSVSKVEATILDDPTAPDPQPLDSVSVVFDPVSGNELAVLGWPPNSSLNVTEYTIIQNDLDPVLPLFNVLDVVLGYNNTYYQNNASVAGDVKECYRVRARNGCGTPGVQDPIDQMQCSMLLDVELEPCAKTNHLTWVRYEGWDEGVREYEVLMSKDGGPELKIAVIDDPLDSTYSHANLQLAADYCYRIRAVRNVVGARVTSTSNKECELVYISKIPDFHYAFKTTVPNHDKVLHNVFVDSTAGITSFEILRGQLPETLGKVGVMEFDSTIQMYEYSDFKAKPDIKAYFYATVALDVCEEPMDTSNITRTIFLDAEAMPDRTNVLTWNSYEGWPSGIEYQNIYRNYYPGEDYSYLATVPTSTLTYTDNVIDLIEGEGNFCYYVEAVQTLPFLLGTPLHSFDETSTSNVACAPQHPNIFVPSAFAPNGVNKVFLPVSVYVDFQSYVFTVYDRFGGKILRTKDKNQGWNGVLGNGMEAAQGVYAYTIEYETAAGIAGVKTGTISLYR